MIKALLADDEYSRLQSLRDFELLDTEPEVEFDEITALAAEVLGMPVALISLVDEKRQWFKSKVGLDIHESDRDTAFCAHAILAPDTIMEVPDTLLDERFHDNPLVADDPQFRFYAGVPLVAANGSAIGTLCVLDYSPRLLSDGQRKILEILARMAMKHIELRYRVIALAKTESFLAAKNCRLEVEIEQSIVSLGDAVNMQIESEMLSRQILDVALDAVISVDKEGRVVYWNPAAEKLFGYTAQDVEGCDVLELLVDKHFHEPVREGMLQFLKNGINAVKNRRFEIKVTRADSKRIPIEVAVSALQRRGVNFFTCFIRDLTERNRYLEEQRLSALTFDVKEGLIITDSDTKVLRVNQGYLDIMRCKADDVVGMPLHFLGHSKQSHDFYRDIWAKVEKEGLWEGEISEETHNGRPIELNVRITAFKGLNDHVRNYVLACNDITGKKRDAGEIHNLAFFDPLTGLPNRRLLLDRLSQVKAGSWRENHEAALLFIDLDNFKDINDARGHDFGDLLLRQVAQRLRNILRHEDTIARIGGDEFVVVLTSLTGYEFDVPAQTQAVAEKILFALSQPYRIQGSVIFSSASIGATLIQSQTAKMDDLLKQADIAMYQAKKSGRNTVAFFDPEMQATVTRNAKLENALHTACEKNQFELFYQGQVDNQRRVVGAEALIRWKHPALGIVPPSDFILLAEKTDLILKIGRWVIDRACQQIALWQKNPHTAGIFVAVNISPRQFQQADFVEQVVASISAAKIAPALLKLEITETLIVDNMKDTIVKMNRLKKAGVQFSLDDFGTGYSSLSYLTKLPLSQLKIDQSFIRNIGLTPGDSIIVKTIVAMAKSLGMQFVAEGVESKLQYEFLEGLGCELFQGYLFSKPVPADEFGKWLEASRK